MAKILVVEDSNVQALVLQQMLERHGLQVRRVPDGQSGLEQARQWLPDVIVLDINMPDMDGFEVCRSLQSDDQTSHIPIIMLTAQDDSSTLRHSISLGAVDFIPKGDFAYAVLLETLRQMYIINEPPQLSEVENWEGDNGE
jgi:CheY-like chemotaxis protein